MCTPGSACFTFGRRKPNQNAGMTIRYMIVDVDDYNAMLARDALHDAGHPSHVFIDPEIALEAIADAAVPYAAVIVNALPGGMSAASFESEVIRRSPQTLVIAGPADHSAVDFSSLYPCW
jgi:DNA-binding NtrC family response regulator